MRHLAKILAILAVLLGSPAVAEGPPAPQITTFVAMFTMPPEVGRCPPCEQMKPIVRRLAATGFPITVIADSELAAKIGIRAYPTFLGIVEGRIVKGIEGVCTVEELRGLIPTKGTTRPPIRDGWHPAPSPKVKPLPDPTNVYIIDRPRFHFVKWLRRR